MAYIELEKEDIEKLRATEVEILDEIVKICDKYNINYVLSGGTLIGAILFQGFIPWDDDLDIAMPRSDYERFLAVAQEELGEKYFLQTAYTDKNYLLPFAKVRKNNTLIVERKAKDCETGHQGIWVDIFPLDMTNNPNSRLLFVKSLLFKFVNGAVLYKSGYYKSIKQVQYHWGCMFFLPLSKNFLSKLQTKIMRLGHNDNKKFLVSLGGSYSYHRDIYPRTVVLPVSKIEFEGKTYNTFGDYNAYIEKLYGKITRDIPEDKKFNHEIVEISFDTTSNNN